MNGIAKRVTRVGRNGLRGLGSFFHRAWNFLRHPGEGTKTCYLLILTGIACFIVTWISQSCTVPLGGDYTLQEMTFLFNAYDDWHTFFRTGVFPYWDRSVFLGIDNIGGNSFYTLFDPFVLILLPFPRSWLLPMQGLELVLKMTLAGMFFYWYLGEFRLNPRVKRIGAVAYGYCGYTFSYLWFHFISSTAFLPLLLLGVERLLKKKDSRILMAGFLLVAMSNYFFFVEYMFGAFFYWCYRYLQTLKERSRTENWAVFGVSFFGFFVSIFLGCFSLLPGISMALNMPRVASASESGFAKSLLNADGLKEIWKILTDFSSSPQAQITPLMNLLFSPFGCYYSNVVSVYWYDNYSASLYATAPMLLIGITGFFESIREEKVSHLLAVALNLFLLFTPLGLYLYNGMTVGYARYYILPLSWLITYDCLTLNRRKDISVRLFDLAFATLLVLDFVALLLAVQFHHAHPDYQSLSSDRPDRLMIPGFTMLWELVTYLVLRPMFHKKPFAPVLEGLVVFEIVVMANTTIYCHGLTNYSSLGGGDANVAEETKIVDAIREGEGGNDFYRIFNTTATRGDINISLREGYNGLGAFHSVYAFGAQDFLDASRIPYSYGNWSMGIHERRENLETFLSTKYYLVPKADPSSFQPNSVPIEDYDIPYGYVNLLSLSDEQKKEYGVSYSQDFLDFLASPACDKSVYLNTNFLDTFFAYDSLIPAGWTGVGFDGGNYYYNYEDINEYPYLRNAILEDEDYSTLSANGLYQSGSVTYNGITTNITGSALTTKQWQWSNAIVSSRAYVENGSTPIQRLSSSSQMNIDVYSANWSDQGYVYGYEPDGTPITQYGSAPFEALVEEYRKEHPLELANGIYPGDTFYDFFTGRKKDGSKMESKDLLYYSKVVVTFPSGTLCPDADPSDPESGYYVSIRSEHNFSWRFFDEDNRLICVNDPSYSDYHQAHGYYVDRPVKTIVGVLNQGNEDDPVVLRSPSIYVTPNREYQKAVDKQKEHRPTILSRNDNEIVFETEEKSPMFYVANIPFQKGWTLYALDAKTGKETEVKTYKAQHGFIGFEVPSGTARYRLAYSSPMATFGQGLTDIGLVVFLLVSLFAVKRKHDGGENNLTSLRPQFEKSQLRQEENDHA